MKYHSEAYNEIIGDVQRIRITDGCPNQCEYCYAPAKMVYHGIPIIVKSKVEILDMNLLSHAGWERMIERISGKCNDIELVCGFDYRYLTYESAIFLKKHKVKKIRFAWDGKINLQYKMKDTVTMLKKAGFKDISVFIIANWKIPLQECLFKLDLLKIWGCKVCDCYFDGQTKNVKPLYWTIEEIKYFKRKCRKHNQMVLFGIDPEPKFKIPFKLKKGQKRLDEY